MKKWLFGFLLLISALSQGQSKIDFSAGVYSLTAKGSTTSSSESGFGAYQFSYRQEFLKSFEFGFNYTMILANGLSGDSSYGPGVLVNYYPMTLASSNYYKNGSINYISQETYKPYIGISLSQRSYQSAQANFGGIGVQVGNEYHIEKNYYLKTELIYLPMNGNGSMSANETNFLIGIVFGL